MPSEIPLKENLCSLAALNIDVPVKTSTDVLRIAFYFSNKEADLIIPPKKIKEYYSWIDNPERETKKFKLNGSQKRIIMKLLNKVAYKPEMKERHKMWNKLAHHIHPTRYEYEFPEAVNALRAMNSSTTAFKKTKTFNSLVTNAPDLYSKLELLKKRPGIFARQLNELLSKHNNLTVLTAFQECGIKISNKVLFELYTYYEKRAADIPRKVFVPGAKKPVELTSLPKLSANKISEIQEIILDILYQKFEELTPLNKVYLDENLKKIPVPTNMKTLEDSLTPVIRGQRNPIDLDKRYALLYCCWDGSTDLDFTVSILGQDNSICKVGYGGSDKSFDNTILFSGDNTGDHAHNSELISVDLENTSAKYILAQVNVYANRSEDSNAFKGSNASLGIMARDDVLQSTHWQPKTVQFAMNPTVNAKSLHAFMLDVEAKEWILIDEVGSSRQVSTGDAVLKYIKEISKSPKFSVYDLLLMHTNARGELVPEIEEADQVFMFDDFSKDYTETIKYML
jgi:hypothetical protein